MALFIKSSSIIFTQQEGPDLYSLPVSLSTLNKLDGKEHCLSRLLKQTQFQLSLIKEKLSMFVKSTKQWTVVYELCFIQLK